MADAQTRERMQLLLDWGNHPFVVCVWALMGWSCAFLCPIFIVRGKGGGDDVGEWWMGVSAFCTVGLYFVGYRLRDSRIMRDRRRWIGNVIGCSCATIITTGIGLAHDNNRDTLIGFTFVAVAVFAFMEISKPVFDFGMLQYFLRLPLQIALVCYGFRSLGWVVFAALLLAFCTIWNAFFMQTFAPSAPSPAASPLEALTTPLLKTSSSTTMRSSSLVKRRPPLQPLD